MHLALLSRLPGGKRWRMTGYRGRTRLGCSTTADPAVALMAFRLGTANGSAERRKLLRELEEQLGDTDQSKGSGE